MDVTETKCEVVPYKECQMGLEQMEYTEKKLAPKLFEEKSCYQGKKKVPHTKLFPNCKNVTKQSKYGDGGGRITLVIVQIVSRSGRLTTRATR